MGLRACIRAGWACRCGALQCAGLEQARGLAPSRPDAAGRARAGSPDGAVLRELVLFLLSPTVQSNLAAAGFARLPDAQVRPARSPPAAGLLGGRGSAQGALPPRLPVLAQASGVRMLAGTGLRFCPRTRSGAVRACGLCWGCAVQRLWQRGACAHARVLAGRAAAERAR